MYVYLCVRTATRNTDICENTNTSSQLPSTYEQCLQKEKKNNQDFLPCITTILKESAYLR